MIADILFGVAATFTALCVFAVFAGGLNDAPIVSAVAKVACAVALLAIYLKLP